MSTQVGDIMSRGVLVARDHWSIKELATFFTDMRITGSPVVDVNGELLGVVTVTDLVKVADFSSVEGADVDNAQDYFTSFLGQSFSEKETLGLLDMAVGSFNVADIMTQTIEKILPEVSVKEAAGMLVKKRVHRIFVVDDQQKLVGICSSTDLLRYFSEA